MKRLAIILLSGLAVQPLAWADTTISTGYDVVQEEGSNLTRRYKINCVGAGITCADDAVNKRTNMTVTAGAGSGDIEAVGPGCSTGACFTDGVTTSGTSILVWEGTGDDANEFTLAAPSANPASDITITFPSATTTLVGTDTTNTLTNKSISGGQITSAVANATSLAANGANCSAGNYPLGVDASGAVESCTDAFTFTSLATASASLDIGNGATSSGILKILEDTDAGTNFATFQVPALAANTVYILPADDGDAGEQLQTNGSGTLSWEAAGAGSGDSITVDTVAVTDPDLASTGDIDVVDTANTVTFNINSETIDAGKYGLASIDGDDVNSNIAGRSITLTAGSPDTLDADAELYTSTKCYRIAFPVAADDDKSIWINNTANQFTVTKLWCESDQTTTLMLQVDDSTPSDMDSVDLSCTSTPATDTSLNGDATIAAGDRVDVDLVSVASSPTWVSVCFTGTWDD